MADFVDPCRTAIAAARCRDDEALAARASPDTLIYLEDDPVHNALRIENGCVAPPRGKGLGIEGDETALRRFQRAVPA
jgi:L-alanine-DL-glutamate epimerase-like enolase superfamily enzyme